MISAKITYTTIDEDIGSFPTEIQEILKTFRKTIRAAAPDAEEAISYQIPTFKLHGNLVHFAAFKNHVSFFPAASGVRVFQKELSRYETSKGTIQFPLNKPLPLPLIRKIVKYRVKENLAKAKKKKEPIRSHQQKGL